MGAIRMILDFVYPAPGCGQPDLRPLVIGKIHFTYFAMILAGTTACIIVVVSLLTAPPDPKHVKNFEIWETVKNFTKDKFTPLYTTFFLHYRILHNYRTQVYTYKQLYTGTLVHYTLHWSLQNITLHKFIQQDNLQKNLSFLAHSDNILESQGPDRTGRW